MSLKEIQQIRTQFPILEQKVHGRDLVYLDNAATTQKPLSVLNAMNDYYRLDNSNIHRGVHTLSQRATDAYEKAREKVRKFIGARFTKEIVFVRGATEGINLVASSFGKKFIHSGDEILISQMEHHSNIVPWQMLAEERGALLKVIPLTPRGELDLSALDALLTSKTKMVGLGHVSNALGTLNPVEEVIARARKLNIPVLIDGAQSASHLPLNVEKMDCDFFVLSGHKMYAPTGIGVVYIHSRWLEKLPPYQGGGDMILSVRFEKTLFNEPPYKFEAGTPNIAGTIGLGAAIDFIQSIGFDFIKSHEESLLGYAQERLSQIPGLRIIGQAPHKAGVVSFVLEGVHPHDIGTILDLEGVAIRTGHHCAQPVMEYFKLPATARASFAIYNTPQEIDALMRALEKVRKVFA